MRFTDVSVEAQPIQPSLQQIQSQPMQTSRGVEFGKNKAAGMVPKRGCSGVQEIGVI